MTIEDTIRIEMMRLQELLGRLEDFKSRHRTTKRCGAENEHHWVANGSMFAVNESLSHAFWECDNCGMKMEKTYLIQDTEINDPWPDLREDEEE
jgi:hypothetical protein